MRKILATDFGLWQGLQSLIPVADQMMMSLDHKSRIAHYLILYDQVIIPTSNFLIIPILRRFFGEDAFEELIKTKSIVFARYNGILCYAGGGKGITAFSNVQSSSSKDEVNFAHTATASLDEAIWKALQVTNPVTDDSIKLKYNNLIIDSTTQFDMQTDVDEIAQETYSDIRSSSIFSDYFGQKEVKSSILELKGVNENQLRVFSPHYKEDKPDHITSVLRVAFQNKILALAGITNATEISGSDLTQTIYSVKANRYPSTVDAQKPFQELLSITNVPDYGKAFSLDQLTAAQILDIRSSKEAAGLRKWLEKGEVGESSDELISRYIGTLKPGFIDSLQMKALRFLAFSGLGLVAPLAGEAAGGIVGGAIGRAASLGASATNTFWLSKWFSRNPPKLFLDRARILMNKNEASQGLGPKEPTVIKRDPNGKCSCGSGKKRKKCCVF